MYLVLSSLPLLHPATTAVFGSCTCTFHLSTLNKHLIVGAGFPIHMIGEVYLEPKKDERMPLSIQSSLKCLRLNHCSFRELGIQ
jgi:hypothetical protein